MLAEDYEATQQQLCQDLTAAGYCVTLAGDGIEALEVLRAQPIDLILSDHRMPRMDGLELFSETQRLRPTPFILYSASASLELSFQAGKDGVVGFLNYPFNVQSQLLPTIETTLRRASEARAGRRRHQHSELIGTSPGLNLVRSEIERYASLPLTVLITGETGTGKDLVARAIHAHSERAAKEFVKVNCPALPESLVESELFGHEKGAFTGADRSRRGRFELADGGTIFLDEVGELQLPVQAKLLQVLQEARFEQVGGSETIEVDVRVIAATNLDLQLEVEEGRFREDLFYRIAQVSIHIPALRERRDDIETLAVAFVDEAARSYGMPPPEVSTEFIEAVSVQPWKGNVRELRDVMERVVVWWEGGSELDALSFLQAYATTNSRLNAEDRALSHQMLQAFSRNGRNQEAARREMNMSRAQWRHRWEGKFGFQILGRGQK